MSQLLLGDFVRLIDGVPVLAERVEDLFAVVAFSTTAKESDVGENDNIGAAVTVSVTSNVASA